MVKNGRRTYSVEDIQRLRTLLDQGARGGRRYLPRRSGVEHLQVITVMNFKGGSGKTTTAAHLAQYLALYGYRVLAVDLDPQASLSALFGHQPEIHVGPNETLYGAIRYGSERRPIAEIVRSTYIPDLHIIPGNIELMEFEHETPKALVQRQSGDTLFFARIGQALAQAQNLYDVVVIDCPPQLGYLTLSALTAATAVLITVHPQMLDVMSMCQFLLMTSNLLGVVAEAGGDYVVGWAIWERPELWVEAEHHAVWRGPDGLVDITPHGIPVEQVLFLPDPGAPYLGPDAPRRPNRRRLLSQGGLAKPFLEAVDARNLWFEQFPAGELKNLTQQQVSAFQDLEKRAALTSADLLIAHANSKSRNDRCLCGSGRKFKICCLPEFD